MIQPISPEVQQRVIVLLAKGHTHPQIKDILKKRYNEDISTRSIMRIKARQGGMVAQIAEALQEHNKATAQSLLIRSHTMLSKVMAISDAALSDLLRIREQWLNEEIELSDYLQAIHELKLPSIAELTSVSKEMFNQTKPGDGPPTKQLPPPTDLTDLLNETDEIKLSQVIFSRSEPVETKTIEVPTKRTKKK